jgi:hypothetical protein
MFHTRLLPRLQIKVFMSREYTPPFSARVGRRLPENQRQQLEDEMRRAIREKNVQLGRARAQNGNHTILVLDTEDFSSINGQLVGHAFATACASLDHSNDPFFPGAPFVWIHAVVRTLFRPLLVLFLQRWVEPRPVVLIRPQL